MKNIFVVSLFLFGISCTAQSPQLPKKSDQVKHLSAIETYELFKSKDTSIVFLDVRSEQEFKEGHIPFAKFLSIHSRTFQTDLLTLDTTKTYVVYCRTGNRSETATEIMEKVGFKKLINMEDGIAGWARAYQPIK